MTIKYRTSALVFKKDEKGESDQIFSVFTEEFGRLDVIGRAIRKITSKLRADIDVFYFSEIEFVQGKSQKTLTDANKIRRFENVANNFDKLKTVYKISDILNSFIKGQEKDNQTFELLIDFFCKLDDCSVEIKNHQLAYHYFFWNFLSLQGYKLEVDNCAVCKFKLNPYNIYFSNKDGGVICKNCSIVDSEAIKINSDIAKILRLILKKDWQVVSRLKIEPSSQKLLDDISQKAVYTFCPEHC